MFQVSSNLISYKVLGGWRLSPTRTCSRFAMSGGIRALFIGTCTGGLYGAVCLVPLGVRVQVPSPALNTMTNTTENVFEFPSEVGSNEHEISYTV